MRIIAKVRPSLVIFWIKKVRYKGANIFIGPEGSFENAEIRFAKSLGFQTVKYFKSGNSCGCCKRSDSKFP